MERLWEDKDYSYKGPLLSHCMNMIDLNYGQYGSPYGQ